ncbi:major capsid protein [Capybara microvirus Cap3_SP_470]|nr:major capsid protein [Capybara microvirus Cap3_SP_470]
MNSRFAVAPQVNINRSTFRRDHTVKTSFNMGELIPFCVEEVLPGDTFSIKTSKLIRTQPLLTPLMDQLYLDTYWYFVPNRLIWEHWINFMGENTDGSWIPETQYSVPTVSAPSSTGWIEHTLADYMGLPVNVPSSSDGVFSVSALPFRAYCKIYNDWFRDENLCDPAFLPLDDSTRVGSNGDSLNDVCLGGMPLKSGKIHDYFSSCLPAPQKGSPVSLGLESVYGDGFVPVFGNGLSLGLHNSERLFGISSSNSSGLLGASSNAVGNPLGTTTSSIVPIQNKSIGVLTKSGLDAVGLPYKDTGLVADVSQSSLTVNSLRYAFAVQRLLEKDARGGSRYIEQIKSHFGVTSPDARLQRSEYLGGNRINININQVLNVAQAQKTGSSEGMLGNVAGYSVTGDSHGDFSKSFTEHGYIIGLMTVRQDNSYCQGTDRFWKRKTRFDYYYPVFANIGEQPVYQSEIYETGSNSDIVFGYQEAWADYRFKPSKVTGMMRNQLDAWHLADKYNNPPVLGKTWIESDKANLDRALAVTSSTADQFFADIFIENKCTRPMPMFSIPGLLDHN